MMRTHIMTGEDYDAFLVERRDGGIRYLALDSVLNVVWVSEADDAFHFSRRSDADRMAAHVPDEWDTRITDHRWTNGTPRDRVVPCIDRRDDEAPQGCRDAVATPRRPAWPLWAIKVAIWAVRGLRRLLGGRSRQ